MTQSQIAIQAAKLRHHKHIGRDAAQRYAFNRGVHPALFRLACQLEAIAKSESKGKYLCGL